MFQSSADLMNHQIRYHRYPCNPCGKTFPTETQLLEHNRKEHDENKRIIHFDCLRCSKSFTKKRYLQKHMNIHNKPYRCTECVKRFSRKSLLLIH
eukprot:UN33846